MLVSVPNFSEMLVQCCSNRVGLFTVGMPENLYGRY